MSDAFALVSPEEPGTGRRELEAYYTPPRLAEAIVARLAAMLRVGNDQAPLRAVMEPHVGGGSFVRPLRANSTRLYLYDVDPTAPGLRPPPPHTADLHVEVRDFLDPKLLEEAPAVNWVVGNPPFDVASDHVRQALQVARTGVAFILPNDWGVRVGNQDLVDGRSRCEAIWPIVGRPSFGSKVGGEAVFGKGNDKYETAVFVWLVGRNRPLKTYWQPLRWRDA